MRTVAAAAVFFVTELTLIDVSMASGAPPLGVLIAAHPLVQAGVVAHDIVRDGQGNVDIDPRTNEPLGMPLHNSKPVPEVIRLLLAVTESRRAPLGSDAPKRLSLMDAAGIR